MVNSFPTAWHQGGFIYKNFKCMYSCASSLSLARAFDERCGQNIIQTDPGDYYYYCALFFFFSSSSSYIITFFVLSLCVCGVPGHFLAPHTHVVYTYIYSSLCGFGINNFVFITWHLDAASRTQYNHPD